MHPLPNYPKFKQLSLEDLPQIKERLQAFAPTVCELSLANLFIYQGSDKTQFTLINGNLCFLVSPPNEAPFFLEPIGQERLLDTVDVCLAHTKKLARVSEKPVHLLPLKKYKISCTRSHFDYLYLTQELAELKDTENKIKSDIAGLLEQEKESQAKIEFSKLIIDANKDKKRSGDVKRLELMMDKNKILSELNLVKIKEDQISHIENDFLNEIKEGGALVGQEILSYKNFQVEITDRSVQEEKRRKIERIKIKLEDAGAGGGSEIIKEFDEVSERDRFLAKEMEDLGKSIVSLQKLIVDLKEKIDIEFKEGIKKINKEFQEFFSLMFGGGSAFLSVIAEQKKRKEEEIEETTDIKNPDEINEKEEIIEQGIEINVSLPRKKVKELHAFSGGERSLTSIALLFAMSQVNPPPFLVLDETDAALDEVNSRKYGDMLEKLSKHSQLIVVTHNRETMSRAGVLYGVTIGVDGASKLLSVKFEEATAIIN